MITPLSVTKLVLFVEDNPDDRQVYGDLLWYNGFDVVHADTAERGYWLALEGQPDLIVLDLNLPDADGLTLCERLKSDPRTASIPVIAVSARDPEPNAHLAATAGCASYLNKPLRPVQVLEEIVRLIGAAPPGAPAPNRRSAPA
jgi:CheY-like chemotaxis protein